MISVQALVLNFVGWYSEKPYLYVKLKTNIMSKVFYVRLKSNDKIVFESGIESRARLNCDFENEYVSES